MPPYGRKSSMRKSAKSRPLGRSGLRTLPKVARPKKPRLTRPDKNQLALSKVVTAVAKMQKQAYGYLQLDRHIFDHRVDPAHPVGQSMYINDLCSEQPVAFCHQCISENAVVYQCKYQSQTTPQTFNVSPIGNWIAQPFLPSFLAGPTLDEYNSQLFWKNSADSSGRKVENKFLLRSVGYDLNFTSLGVAGMVQICMVTEKNSMRNGNQNTEMPSSLRSFVNTCPMSGSQNVPNARFWNVKVLKQFYTSTIALQGVQPNAPTSLHVKGQVFQTYSQKHFHLKVTSNSKIAVSDPDTPIDAISFVDLPVKKRTWIMIRTSVSENNISTAFAAGGIPDHVTPGTLPYQRLSLQIMRTPCWSDATGAST